MLFGAHCYTAVRTSHRQPCTVEYHALGFEQVHHRYHPPGDPQVLGARAGFRKEVEALYDLRIRLRSGWVVDLLQEANQEQQNADACGCVRRVRKANLGDPRQLCPSIGDLGCTDIGLDEVTVTTD